MNTARLTLTRRGIKWEYRGVTPGGMIRLWSLDGTCSLTANPAEISDLDALRPLVRPMLAERGAGYDRDDWITLPIEGVVDMLANVDA